MGLTIVISAVNLRKGGTLTILNDCLQAFSKWNSHDEHRVVAVVHSRELAPYPHIEYIEIPWSIRSWGHRLWCEYMTMHKISKRLAPVILWLSLHDTTPRVKAERQAVYCHNSYPFFRWRWCHLLLNYRIVCFSLFTKWIYRINIHRNRYIIVQQEWFRQAFQQMFGIDREKIVVSPPPAPNPSPSTHHPSPSTLHPSPSTLHLYPSTFLYPAFPDVHKNMECLCEATRLLEEEMGDHRFEVVLTTSPDFNKYSRWIHKKWGHVRSLKFVGFLTKEQLNEQYAVTDCLVFPSKVETWGLPISEFMSWKRTMLLADLPYAHETAAGSLHTAFFNPEDPQALKEMMKRIIENNFLDLKPVAPIIYNPPVATDWQQTIELLTT